MQYTELDGIGPVLFERSKRAKRIIITVTPHNGVRVAIPNRTSIKKAKDFTLSKTNWIKKQLLLINEAEREFENKSKTVDPKTAKQELKNRIEELATQNGFKYGKVSIRNQKTRWGSCSDQNNISLNMKLVLLPDELMDYVILHELVHTKIKNHSKKFWAELDKYTGNAKQKAADLRKYGLVLL